MKDRLKQPYIQILIGSFFIYCYILFGTDFRGASWMDAQWVPFLWIGILSAIFGIIKFSRHFGKGRQEKVRDSLNALSLALSMAGLAATGPIGKLLLERDVEKAKDYC
ncbi:hypothetical protein N9129_01025 [Akkermansiaceae bacterium]|nr:hypothetical protein [bacterium]MDB4451775.1 hypothetical protein [Akkermansiaceae bacterium]